MERGVGRVEVMKNREGESGKKKKIGKGEKKKGGEQEEEREKCRREIYTHT